jgi:hypothetical protein
MGVDLGDAASGTGSSAADQRPPTMAAAASASQNSTTNRRRSVHQRTFVVGSAAGKGQRGAGHREQHGEHPSSQPEAGLKRCSPDEAPAGQDGGQVSVQLGVPWRPFHWRLTPKTEVSKLQLLAAIADAGGYACVASCGSWP